MFIVRVGNIHSGDLGALEYFLGEEPQYNTIKKRSDSYGNDKILLCNSIDITSECNSSKTDRYCVALSHVGTYE